MVGAMTAPHQWPPDAPEIGLMAGWSEESMLERAKSELHDRLIVQLGDLRAGPVEWRWFDHEIAGAVLDVLVESEIDEAVFDYYRTIRGRLREFQGLLVIAWAPVVTP